MKKELEKLHWMKKEFITQIKDMLKMIDKQEEKLAAAAKKITIG